MLDHGVRHLPVLDPGRRLIGVLDDKLQEVGYSSIADKKTMPFKTTNGWLGITDKYWAAALLPETTARLKARFLAEPEGAGLDAETQNGPMVLYVPEGYNAQLETGTTNGPMSIGFPITVMNHPPFIRMEGRSLPPLSSRKPTGRRVSSTAS